MGSADRESTAASNGLLGPGDVPPIGAVNAGAASPFLLIGDHAGRAIPRALGDLGLAPGELERHIACDIGIEAVGVHLAASLGAAFLWQRYSRLVIDCNRAPGSPESIVTVSDGAAVPGNVGLSPIRRRERREAIFDPYHARIAGELDARAEAGLATVLISLHSFTPWFDGRARPWRFGVLHQGDSPFSGAILALLRAELGEAAGDNQPYAMDATDFTAPAHRRGRNIDYLELEIRQDLVAAPAGQASVATRLAGLLPRALGDALGPSAGGGWAAGRVG